jgi:hypothetical protein
MEVFQAFIFGVLQYAFFVASRRVECTPLSSANGGLLDSFLDIMRLVPHIFGVHTGEMRAKPVL